jgi:hypothetical protein
MHEHWIVQVYKFNTHQTDANAIAFSLCPPPPPFAHINALLSV